MKYAALIVATRGAGGLPLYKGLARVAGKAMIEHVMSAVPDDFSEIFISADSQEEAYAYAEAAERFGATTVWSRSPSGQVTDRLVAAFERSDADTFLVLPCDTPMVSRALLTFLLEVAPGFNAVIPRWPNGDAEMLHASYNRGRFVECTSSSKPGQLLLSDLVARMGNVLYVLTETLKQVDERLDSFFVVESKRDLARVQSILERGAKSGSKQSGKEKRGDLGRVRRDRR